MLKTAFRTLCLSSVLTAALAIPAAQAGSEEKARALLDLLDTRHMMETIMLRVSDRIIGNLQQHSRIALPADVPDIVKGVAHDTLEEQLPLLYDDTVKIYAQNLPDSEMDALIAFYRTPAGQDYVKKLPILEQQGAASAQARMATVIPVMQRTLLQTLREKHPELFERGPGTELNPVPR